VSRAVEYPVVLANTQATHYVMSSDPKVSVEDRSDGRNVTFNGAETSGALRYLYATCLDRFAF
jgi:hypothetical protein